MTPGQGPKVKVSITSRIRILSAGGTDQVDRGRHENGSGSWFVGIYFDTKITNEYKI